MTKQPRAYTQAARALKKAKTVLIASHYNPDGDALGSTVALALGLQKLKKKVYCYNRDRVPYNLEFLPHMDWISPRLPKEKIDCVVMVDCAQPKRISDAFLAWIEKKNFGQWLCIDHHLLDHKIGDIDLIDPKAAATGCVIWNLLKKMKIHGGTKVAKLVYCTLVVDTGFFHYSNTTASVLTLASELVKEGADPWEAAQNLEESNPPERYLLLGQALRTLRVSQKGRYATMEVTQGMLKSIGAGDDLAEEFSNFPRSIRGVEVAAMFREVADGRLKLSLRSKNEVDVSAIAKQFGGGGHEHAAGCFMKPPLAKAKVVLEKVIKKVLS